LALRLWQSSFPLTAPAMPIFPTGLSRGPWARGELSQGIGLCCDKTRTKQRIAQRQVRVGHNIIGTAGGREARLGARAMQNTRLETTTARQAEMISLNVDAVRLGRPSGTAVSSSFGQGP
jgi:hypothetical protein